MIIHCARSPSFEKNVKTVKLLLDKLPSSSKLVLMGSNSVFARPRSSLARVLQWRRLCLEKRALERMARKFQNVILVRPP